MSALNFKIDETLCVRCGMCQRECPMLVITQEDNSIPAILQENEGRCIKCQHCLAICPTGALSIVDKIPADSLVCDKGEWPSLEQMNLFVRGRRSVRSYKKENVDKALIQRLLCTAANAPTGANYKGLRFHVIDDMAVLDSFRTRVMEALKDMSGKGLIPEHMQMLNMAVDAYYEHGMDVVFRGAPHALIVSATPETLTPTEDVNLTLAYFELLAQSAGLGTVWWGMIKMTMEMIPSLKEVIGLPADEFYYPMLFGYPAVKFQRTVQRDDSIPVSIIEM